MARVSVVSFPGRVKYPAQKLFRENGRRYHSTPGWTNSRTPAYTIRRVIFINGRLPTASNNSPRVVVTRIHLQYENRRACVWRTAMFRAPISKYVYVKDTCTRITRAVPIPWESAVATVATAAAVGLRACGSSDCQDVVNFIIGTVAKVNPSRFALSSLV